MKGRVKEGLRMFRVLAAVFACIACVLVSSCTQDDIVPTPVVVESAEEVLSLRSGGADYGIQIVSGQKLGESTHGVPNSTVYKFFAAGVPSNTTKIDIVFTAPDQNQYTHTMSKLPNGNWYKEMSLSQAGRYTVKYHLFAGLTCTAIATPIPSYVDNTRVRANIASNTDNSWIRIHWVFGADGSSYSNNSAYKNGERIKWLDGNADGPNFGGYGWDEGTHKNVVGGNQEKYALDYNIYPYSWTSGPNPLTNLDQGSVLRSPLDGIVVEVQNNASSAYGKFIVIRQYLGAKEFRAYLGHLQDIYVQVGNYVVGGVTNVGTVGNTGATGYHLHMNVWDRTGGLKNSLKHELSAAN